MGRFALIWLCGLTCLWLAGRRGAPTTGESSAPHASVPDPLTARQREILSLVGTGMTGKEIAAHARISESSVRTHIRRARGRLGAANSAAAVALMLEPRRSGAVRGADARLDA